MFSALTSVEGYSYTIKNYGALTTDRINVAGKVINLVPFVNSSDISKYYPPTVGKFEKFSRQLQFQGSHMLETCHEKNNGPVKRLKGFKG